MPTATSQIVSQLQRSIARAIYGKEEAIQLALITLLARGHLLIEDVPGVGKTTLAHALAKSFHCSFQRVQFTSDLLPTDVLGVSVYNPETREFEFRPGPIFANIVLADEINRTPPKTQAAMLEAMQELSCTVRGNHYTLPSPFFVLATQNPIELEGTYPLPEAQLDRFLFNTVLDYLTAADELKVVDLTTTTRVAQVDAVTSAEEILDFQQLVRMVPIGDSLAQYVVNLVRATRHNSGTAPDFIQKYVNYGASVRAAQFIVLSAKARALAHRRYHVAYEDILALAIPVLRHRILLNFHAESDRVDSDEILKRLLQHMPPPAKA